MTEAPIPARKIKNWKNSYDIVALMDARGAPPSEIAEATGYAPNYIWRIQNELPQYPSVVSDFKREIAERVVEDTADAITMFNRKVPDMINNLEDLALNANKEGVQLRATMDWLDRAPDAPKRVSRQENTEERKIIFSLQQTENVRAALIDVGEAEVLELFEGEDYTICESQNVLNVDDD
jgi:hypothetical protein